MSNFLLYFKIGHFASEIFKGYLRAESYLLSENGLRQGFRGAIQGKMRN